MWLYIDNIVNAVVDILGLSVTPLIAFCNIILILFIFIQLRDARKPILITSIISRDKEVTERPDVLESDNLYIAVINNSKNIAKAINIDYEFDFNGKSVKVIEKLSHLNSGEATKIVLKTKSIRERCTDLFEVVREGNTTKIIPKKTLKIDLIVRISYNPIIVSFFEYKLEDNYLIEWGSLKSYPTYKDHPVFLSWNRRNGYYIYKTMGQESKEKMGGLNEWQK
jgi:hypothetical protein